MKNYKLNSKEFKSRMKDYILNAIDGDPYEQELNTEEKKARFLWNTFNTDYVHENNLRRHGGNIQSLFTDWITGLPSVFNIDFENHAILELCKKHFETLEDNATDAQEQRTLDNWWNIIARETFNLFEKYNLINP